MSPLLAIRDRLLRHRRSLLRRRRRLERALAAARRRPPLPADPAQAPRAQPAAGRRDGRLRFWLLPIAAIALGLLVTAWSVWNVFAR